MAHRAPGPESFAFHTPKAQPNEPTTAMCGVLHKNRRSQGASAYYPRRCFKAFRFSQNRRSRYCFVVLLCGSRLQSSRKCTPPSSSPIATQAARPSTSPRHPGVIAMVTGERSSRSVDTGGSPRSEPPELEDARRKSNSCGSSTAATMCSRTLSSRKKKEGES